MGGCFVPLHPPDRGELIIAAFFFEIFEENLPGDDRRLSRVLDTLPPRCDIIDRARRRYLWKPIAALRRGPPRLARPADRISSPSYKGASPPFQPPATLLSLLPPALRSGNVNNAYVKNALAEIYPHLLTRASPSSPVNNNTAKRDTQNRRPKLRCGVVLSSLLSPSSLLSSPGKPREEEKKRRRLLLLTANAARNCIVLHCAKLYFVQRTSSMRNRSLSRMNRPHHPWLLLRGCMCTGEGGRKGHICMYAAGRRSPPCSTPRVAGLRRASAGSLITMLQLQINKVLIGRCSYTSRALVRAAAAPICCRKLARVRRTWPLCGKRNGNLGTRFCGSESDHAFEG